MSKAEFTSYQTPRVMADAGMEYQLNTDGSMEVSPPDNTSKGPGSSKGIIIGSLIGIGLLAWFLLGREIAKGRRK